LKAGTAIGVFALLGLLILWQGKSSQTSSLSKLVQSDQSTPAPWPTPTSPVNQAIDPGSVFTFDCETSNNFKPESFFFACADGNDGITAITWSSWDVKGAKGTGKSFTNDCNPSCVDGTVHYSPVEIYLDSPVQMGKSVFLTMLHYRTGSSQDWSTWDLSRDYLRMK
jgi:hypothetical protein